MRRTWDEAVQVGEHLAAIAEAERERVRTGEEGRELIARPRIEKNRLRPPLAGTEDVALRILQNTPARDVVRTHGEWRDGSWQDFDPRTPLAA